MHKTHLELRFEILTHKQQEEEIEKGCERERERELSLYQYFLP